MNTRKRSKKLTPEQRNEYQKWQNERVKIANLIARKAEIDKICCVCGKAGKILHNRKDPYYIAFICDECKKDPSNLEFAEENRFDLRTILDKTNLCTNHFSDEEVIRIIVGYMNENVSIGEYCDSLKISRHQFGQLMDRYKVLLPDQNIVQMVKSHSKRIQSEKLKKINRINNEE